MYEKNKIVPKWKKEISVDHPQYPSIAYSVNCRINDVREKRCSNPTQICVSYCLKYHCYNNNYYGLNRIWVVQSSFCRIWHSGYDSQISTIAAKYHACKHELSPVAPLWWCSWKVTASTGSGGVVTQRSLIFPTSRANLARGTTLAVMQPNLL